MIPLAAHARRAFWRCALLLTGGLDVEGRLPAGRCAVVVAADPGVGEPALLGALLAALPARAAPGLSVSGRGRARLGSGRSGTGGSGGLPLVPVGVATGPRRLFGGLPLGAVAVRIGPPGTDPDAVLAGAHARRRAPVRPVDSRVRLLVARLAASPYGLLLAFCWSVAEAASWPLLPEILLAVLVVACPRRGPALALTAAAGSVAGGLLVLTLGTHAATLPEPLTTPRMHVSVAAAYEREGAVALRRQPLSGVPYKVWAAEAAVHGVDPVAFVRESALARGSRIVVVGLLLAGLAALARRGARLYPLYLAYLLPGYAIGLALVVRSWT